MKFQMLIFCVFLMSFYKIPAQTNQTPPSTQPARRSSDTQKRENTQISKSANDSFNDLRNIDIPQTVQKTPLEIMGQDIQPLYRKPNKKDLKDLIPYQNLVAQYEKFLQQPNTGIFKLSADPSCAVNTGVIVAKENCLTNTIPGAGTAYSFRVNSHRILHLADLILVNDILKTDGIMQQGLMVKLGNIELDEISTNSNGLKFLLDFKPAATKEELQKLDKELSDGIKADGFIYRFAFYVDDKTTFALRSIAYRGKMMRSVKGVNYNEMDYDKRKDILVVFRIVEKASNGDVTILWKEIFHQDSPVLNLAQKDK